MNVTDLFRREKNAPRFSAGQGAELIDDQATVAMLAEYELRTAPLEQKPAQRGERAQPNSFTPQLGQCSRRREFSLQV